MGGRIFLCLLLVGIVHGEADPAILSGADLANFQQGRPPLDPRPRLSASQQAQILSDVQQHQQRYRRPQDDPKQQSYSSLAKYKVDRSKQQQIQQLLQQQQQVQQLIQQQQQKIAQQLNDPNYLGTPPTQRQQFASSFQNIRQDLSQPLFSDQQTVQLQDYLDKQRELESLQKQREQLLLEQQQVRRQQELLRLQQLQKLTSTTPRAPAPVISSTVAASTVAPLLVSLPTARKITPSETDLFLKAIATHQKKFSTTPIPATVAPTVTTRSLPEKIPQNLLSLFQNQQDQLTTQDKPKPQIKVIYQTEKSASDAASSVGQKTVTSGIPENLLSLIQEQQDQLVKQGKPKPQIKVIYQTEKPQTAKPANTKARSPLGSDREILLKQLKLALAQSVDDDVRNVSTRDIVLPNGRKIQLIDGPGDLTTTAGSTATGTTVTTTIKPPKAILEELTKGVLPPGADFEVIRQKSDGKLEEIGKTPIQNLPAKKVTFVVLEEQPDGSYKVQGVKGNAEKEGGDVDSIVEKIKKGELKLPPSSSNSNVGSSIDLRSQTPGLTTQTSQVTGSIPTRPTTTRSTPVSTRFTERPTEYFPQVTVSPNSVSTTDKYLSSASSVTSHVFNSLSTTPKLSSVNQDRVTTKYPTSTRSHFIPTMAPVNEIITTTVPTSFSHPSTNSYIHFTAGPSEASPTTRTASTTARPVTNSQDDNVIYHDNFERTTLAPPTESSNKAHESLTSLLRKEGLFAMAKYLRQSGLDNVLNETGPYTLFVPTDKAFRTLLVQLGGPEKAEQKFRDNPRLLSGLLLHHVIPGGFRINSLQDEMTGVSLAGTQLRVNEYAMHDHEWNDIKVTTINGARVAPNKRDIEIPQGIAHAVDRVMFPLPVGDLVQTMQADRERRFTTFLKMLYISGFQDTLSGPKTFTVFAPTDSAFEAAISKDGAPVWTEDDGPEAAKTIISRHIVPSTLYTAGMRYYLQKDTLRPQSPVHIHKNAGRVRINEVQVVTHNVPATNGVLHAIDGVL